MIELECNDKTIMSLDDDGTILIKDKEKFNLNDKNDDIPDFVKFVKIED